MGFKNRISQGQVELCRERECHGLVESKKCLKSKLIKVDKDFRELNDLSKKISLGLKNLKYCLQSARAVSAPLIWFEPIFHSTNNCPFTAL